MFNSIINSINTQIINIYNFLTSYTNILNFMSKPSRFELLQTMIIVIIPLIIFTLIQYIINNWKESIIIQYQKYFIYSIGVSLLLIILSFYISMPVNIIITAIIPSFTYIIYSLYLPKHNILCHCIYFIYILLLLILKLYYIPMYYLITIFSIVCHYYTHVNISTPWYVYIYKGILMIISYQYMQSISNNPTLSAGFIAITIMIYLLFKYIMKIGTWLQNNTNINHIFAFILYILSAMNVVYYKPINNFGLQMVLLLLGLNYMYRPSNTPSIQITNNINPFKLLVLLFGVGLLAYICIISGYSIIAVFIISLIGCLYNFYILWNKFTFNIFLKISILLLCSINLIYRFMSIDPNISLIGFISLICINITSIIFNYYIKNNTISNIIIFNILYNTFAIMMNTHYKIILIIMFVIYMYNRHRPHILEPIIFGIYNQIITSGLVFILLPNKEYIYLFGYLFTLICMFTATFNNIETISVIHTIMSLYKIYNKNSILFNNMSYHVPSRLWMVNYTSTINILLTIVYISILRNNQHLVKIIYNKYIQYMCILCVTLSTILYIFNMHVNIYILIPITYISIYSLLYLYIYTISHINDNLLYKYVFVFAFIIFNISLPDEFIILLPILITICKSIMD